MFKKIGPGVLVAAAFIGPGTVTTCILAGTNYGYTLLWAMLLSILATIVLQEMAARLGIVTQMGLADVIRQEIKSPVIRNLVIGIILSAIVIGNAAYEGGNIGGGALGLEAIFGEGFAPYYSYCVGIIAFLLLFIGSYKVLEKIFISLVVLMSVSFVISALMTKPNLSRLLIGLFKLSASESGLLMVMALVGTTVVPYNLFLHAALVREKWKSHANLRQAQRDAIISIVLGGIVSMAIIIAAAAIPYKKIETVKDLAQGLEPLYGNGAKYLMGIGLFAAGITSAITAPLAAAYVANSCFDWKANLKDIRFRTVWMIILILGVIFTSLGFKPLKIIQFAQVANGILLPVIAIFLIWAVNRGVILGSHINTRTQNILGLIIVAFTLVLGIKSIFKVFGI